MAPISEVKRKGNPNRIKKEEVTESTPDVSALLNEMMVRMDKLESENADLKSSIGKEVVTTVNKKRNEDARLYCYKMRAWVPVCSYESKTKDPSKGLQYKDWKGNFIDNHLAILSLANGEKVEVLMNEFWRDYTVSEKMIALDHNGEEIFPDTIKRVKSFTFNTKEHWTFTVLPNSING